MLRNLWGRDLENGGGVGKAWSRGGVREQDSSESGARPRQYGDSDGEQEGIAMLMDGLVRSQLPAPQSEFWCAKLSEPQRLYPHGLWGQPDPGSSAVPP